MNNLHEIECPSCEMAVKFSCQPLGLGRHCGLAGFILLDKPKNGNAEKPMAKQMQDRAEKLAGCLIDVFGYTDSQLICSMTLAAIGNRIIEDRLNESDDGG